MQITERKARFVQKLSDEKDALAAKVNHADAWLKKTQEDVDAALRSKERVAAEVRAGFGDGRFRGDDAQAFDMGQAAGVAHNNARHAVRRAQDGVNELHRERARLAEINQLLGSEERLGAASQRLAVAMDMAASSTEALKQSEAALASINGLLQTEERAHENAKAQAAATLLRAVKAGADTSEIAAASRDKIATLEMAKASAEEELAAANAAVAAAERSQTEAMAECKSARIQVETLFGLIAAEASAEAERAARALAIRELSGAVLAGAVAILGRTGYR